MHECETLLSLACSALLNPQPRTRPPTPGQSFVTGSRSCLTRVLEKQWLPFDLHSTCQVPLAHAIHSTCAATGTTKSQSWQGGAEQHILLVCAGCRQAGRRRHPCALVSRWSADAKVDALPGASLTAQAAAAACTARFHDDLRWALLHILSWCVLCARAIMLHRAVGVHSDHDVTVGHRIATDHRQSQAK